MPPGKKRLKKTARKREQLQKMGCLRERMEGGHHIA